MAHKFADGSEVVRERTPEEQKVTNGEIRMLFGRWRDRGEDRRKVNLGGLIVRTESGAAICTGKNRRCGDRRRIEFSKVHSTAACVAMEGQS